MGHDEVEGLVRSVSGNRIQLTQRDRTAAAVDFTPSTMVTELGPAKVTDVTPGSCVDVEAAAQGGPPGAPVTAQSVTISPSERGKCPPDAMAAAAETEAQKEEARIQASVEEDKRKIVAAAEQEIVAATRLARTELRAYVSELAVTLAEKRIQVSASTDQDLVRAFVDQLGKNGK